MRVFERINGVCVCACKLTTPRWSPSRKDVKEKTLIDELLLENLKSVNSSLESKSSRCVVEKMDVVKQQNKCSTCN